MINQILEKLKKKSSDNGSEPKPAKKRKEPDLELNITFREATIIDLFPLSVYLRKGYKEEFGYPYHYDPESFILNWTQAMGMNPDNHVIYVATDEKERFLGAIGGGINVHPFTKNSVYAKQIFWFVDPSVRGKDIGNKLLSMFEYWAMERSAEYVLMDYVSNKSPEHVKSYLEKKGFSELETTMIKPLKKEA